MIHLGFICDLCVVAGDFYFQRYAEFFYENAPLNIRRIAGYVY